MGRTPKEIKKGLECFVKQKFPNAYCECSYLKHPARNLWECPQPEIMSDALAYIWQLEQINADFAERTARLETQVGKDTNAPRWISLEDRRPKNGQLVLTVDLLGIYEVLRYSEVKDAFVGCGDLMSVYNIVRWMPLPDL